MGYDYIFVGGGLASALSALALAELRPDRRFAVVEQGATWGGNHTWCFHARDVPASARTWLEPLVTRRWGGYEVRFPRRTRRLQSPYACVTSERLSQALSARLSGATQATVLLGTRARSASAHRVELEDGRVLEARAVVDARGPKLDAGAEHTGYQKFLGLELEVEPDHGLHEPVLIDACVPQHDGFRFLYVLPLEPQRVLFEDTFFSDDPALNDERREQDIVAYASAKGFRVTRVLRKERGVLPMPWGGSTPRADASPICAGYSGGFFHPVTGYSFPLAVRFAEALAQSDPQALEGSRLARFAEDHAEQMRFLFVLTRLMFTCFRPEQRYAVLEHFYRLPEPLIERFYAAQLSGVDRARIFLGAPPRGFSMRRALGFPREATR